MFGRPLTAQDAYAKNCANNALAQIRSDLRRMEQGDIMFRSEAGTDTEPAYVNGNIRKCLLQTKS